MKLKELILNKSFEPITQLSRKIGVSTQTIYNIMEDKHNPSLLTIKKICKYFNVDFKDYI